jgi:hypothetical protein
MNEFLTPEEGLPVSPSSYSLASASGSTESSTSPYRRSRFEGRTRRSALEQRFGKVGSQSPSRQSDEKKEDDYFINEALEEEEGQGLMSSAKTNANINTNSNAPISEECDSDFAPRAPPRREERKGFYDGENERRAYGEFPEFCEDEKRSNGSTTVSTATATSHGSSTLAPSLPPILPPARAQDHTRRNSRHSRLEPQDAQSQHESMPPPSRPQHFENPPSMRAPDPVQEQSEGPVRYYRVVYRGVVAVLSAPDTTANRSGSYLSYGEIFSSRYEMDVDCDSTVAPALEPRLGEASSGNDWSESSPPPQSALLQTTGSMSSLDTLKASSTLPPPLPRLPDCNAVGRTSTRNNNNNNSNKVIRVDCVLTGGYAMDALDGSQTESGAETPKRSNMHHLPAGVPSVSGNAQTQSANDANGGHETSDSDTCVGFIFARRKDLIIVEPLHSTPTSEQGKFLYKIMSSTPLPILTGPSLDAPKTKAMVLPGTVHEVSLRVSMDPEGGGTFFLRLSHRRGWIVDRKISARKGDPVPVVKEVTSCGTLADDGSVSLLSITASVATPSSTARRRHRLPRRRIDASKEPSDKNSLPPRQISGKFPPTGTPVKIEKSLNDTIASERYTMTPSSNVSVLSDDSSMDQNTSRHPVTASSDVSFSTNRSVGPSSATTSFFLMRVTAPRGLKILDAPQFQVNNLIHGKQAGTVGRVASSHMVSQFESNMGPPKSQHSIFQTMSTRLATTGPSKTRSPAVFDSSSRTRVLPRGAAFEACRQMESSGAYSQGAGLIKLSDNSGWAIVPRQDELDHQYRNYHGGVAGVKEGEATRAFEEVGNAIIDSSGTESVERGPTTLWLRITAKTGLAVSCPPPVAPTNDDDTSPTSSRGSSAISGSIHGSGFGPLSNAESDVASSVGSAFLDAMFRTPKKKDGDSGDQSAPSRYPASIEKQLQANTVACGMCVEVEKCKVESASSQEFVRLRGGQGWLPLEAAGKAAVVRVPRPDFRFGSFWFRVKSSRGIKVRLGPSRKAASIKSEDGVYYRFECGEFLRASEIMTVFSDESKPIECFAKLYRNRHVQLHTEHDEFRQLPSLTTQAEWVQVFGRDELNLDECAADPRIERHKLGWRYNVVPESGVAVRRGPSFAAEKIGLDLLGGESVLINERVSPAGENMSWLRIKDGRGWIHDTADDGTEIMRAHSLRHRGKGSVIARPQKAPQGEKDEVAYNAIIARLFHNDVPSDAYRPPKDLRGLQR